MCQLGVDKKFTNPFKLSHVNIIYYLPSGYKDFTWFRSAGSCEMQGIYTIVLSLNFLINVLIELDPTKITECILYT